MSLSIPVHYEGVTYLAHKHLTDVPQQEYTYIHTYTHTHTDTHTYIHYIHPSIHPYIHTYIFIYTHIRVYVVYIPPCENRQLVIDYDIFKHKELT